MDSESKMKQWLEGECKLYDKEISSKLKDVQRMLTKRLFNEKSKRLLSMFSKFGR